MIVALSVIVQLGCTKGVSGSCDFRLGSTIAPYTQECDQYDNVQVDGLQAACEQQDQPNGKWTHNGKCVGQVVATCRYSESGGTVTQYYYSGTDTESLLLDGDSCVSGPHPGTWCNGTACP
jgi:hypothetical protein